MIFLLEFLDIQCLILSVEVSVWLKLLSIVVSLLKCHTHTPLHNDTV